MESDAPAPLLSLTGAVEDILLSYVSAAEGGVQSVLNLREVCSTTKMWVDTLQPLQAKRIFSSRQAKVELSVEHLEEFHAAPPGVTSLCLTEMDSLSDHRFPPEKEELWNRFVSFWSPKLECLTVDVLYLPLNLRLDQLLSCASLRSLHCETIKHNDGKPAGLPESLFRFETLLVGRVEMGIEQKREFFSRLSTQQSLKHLILNIEDIEGLTGIADLIENKRAVEDFKLSLTVDAVKVFASTSLPEMDRLKASYVRLATAVANSSSSFRIRGLEAEELFDFVWQEVERETAEKFFRNVVGMSYYFGTISHLDFRAADFPNLETFTLLTNGDYEEVRTLEATAFPWSLKKLQVDDGFPRPASLPSTLTHLDIQRNPCTVNQLLVDLFSLAEECPSLKNLKLNWVNGDWAEAEGDPSYGVLSFATSPQFKSLKSLDFHAHLKNEREAAVFRMILLHGFKLPQLVLRDLKLSFEYGMQKVDHNLLIALITGPISKSLLNVDIAPSFVVEDAHPLLEILKSTAAENKRKRVEIHGKERDRKFNR